MRRRSLTAISLAFLLSAVGGCAARSIHADTQPHLADGSIQLNEHALRLHFANPGAAGSRPLLVYATGDGGWHRKDLGTYRRLVSSGNPLVGFDARDYVTHLGPAADATTTPARLAADYARIIDAARGALGLPAAYPVVLVGVSRGAGLAVVAAGQGTLRASIGGVLAIALTREEEYVNEAQLYQYLSRLEDMPVAVVQSTRDGYLPADEARRLFGPDTPYRWLQPIQARNHSFGGARGEMYQAAGRALDWIESLIARG